jgi:hypothetical protein
MNMGLRELMFVEGVENQPIQKIIKEDENLSDEEIEIDISEFKQIEELLRDDEYIEIETNKSCKSKYGLVNKRIDVNKIRHKTVKNLEVKTSILKNVKMETDGGPIRSGAIIYTHYEGKTYFCLGVDSVYGDLTDFAGGVKKEESIIGGGLRELEEESQGIFGKITEEEVENCMTFYTNNMLIMFIRRDVNMGKTEKLFFSQINQCSVFKVNNSIEVSGIVWLESKEFVDSILGKGRRTYSRVKRILSKVVSIIEAL